MFVDGKNVVRIFDLDLNDIVGAEFEISSHSKILVTPDDGFLAALSIREDRKMVESSEVF